MSATAIAGFLNFYKPVGCTSHDCVAQVRRRLGRIKTGHGGTLDPDAAGVLPLALGRATRLLPFLPGDKAYRAVIRFGLTTTTDDLAGDVLTATPVPNLTEAAAIAPLPQFLGQLEQIPPRYSAVQVGGQRLYDLARRGTVVEVPRRTVTVHQIHPLHWQPGDFPELTLAVTCGPGTYIRSIARDWGAQLGVGATLAALVRTQSSGFELENSITLGQLEAAIADHTFTPISPLVALPQLPRLTLPGDVARRWRQGQKPFLSFSPLPPHPEAGIVALDEAGEFLGITTLALGEDPSQLQLIPRLVFQPWP